MNFREILSLVGKHDSVVLDRLSEGPRNATYIYTSPEILNTIMATMVRNKM